MYFFLNRGPKTKKNHFPYLSINNVNFESICRDTVNPSAVSTLGLVLHDSDAAPVRTSYVYQGRERSDRVSDTARQVSLEDRTLNTYVAVGICL